MNIVTIGSERADILRSPTTPVTEFTSELAALMGEMNRTMRREHGVGLAAPQVGSRRRVCVMLDGPSTCWMVNPEIVRHGKDTLVSEEGCLSIPGFFVKVERWRIVDVEYQDIHGVSRKKTFVGTAARIAQHEIDHLDGILMTDRTSA